MRKIDKPTLPLPEPLSGSVYGSFAYETITERMPRIARETIAENDFTPQARVNLESLIQDLPNAPIRKLNDAAAPDAGDWQVYVAPHLGEDWLSAPWFFAEIYFYRRILEAIGYYQQGEYQGYDPFLSQKARLLAAAESSTNFLAEQLEEALRTSHFDEAERRRDLQRLLALNVWGNQADLSMWSTEEERPNHRDYQAQQEHLLVDDSSTVVNHLLHLADKPIRVDFVLDNYGPELAHDLSLADYLLSAGLAGSVIFHAKPYPYYVSDAMIKDVHAMLDWFATRPDERVRALGARCSTHILTGQLKLSEDFFWTSPLSFWEMPVRIRELLETSDLVISKGDANYRRLVGDRYWPHTTPFADVVGYFPAPLLALRVLKAELALGLTAEKVAQLNADDPDWLVNGNWAVIQFEV